MVNVKFLGFPLVKSQNINLSIANIVKKLMKEISSSRYCPKIHPNIPKVLYKLGKNLGIFGLRLDRHLGFCKPQII